MASINTISQSVRYGLHYAASWPDTSFSILRKIFWVILFSVLHSRQYSYLIAHFRSDTVMEIIDCLSICLPMTLVSIKLIVAWTHHSLLRKIVTNMEEECEKYAVIDTDNLISKTAHLSYRLTTAIMCTYVTSTVFYAIGVLTPQRVNMTASREILMKMDLPFDTSKSPIYELVVIVQYFYQVSAAYIFGAFTAFLLMVVLHVGCQIDIMCQILSKAPCGNVKRLKFFISRHQDIIIFLESIEQFFTYITLSQLVSNTMLTCCLGYLIVITLKATNDSNMLVKCVLFYFSACIEAFIYCFAGEYLSIKIFPTILIFGFSNGEIGILKNALNANYYSLFAMSKLISDTAYECFWYDLHPNESRLLIPVILRSQRGFSLTCGKFANLSMEIFTSMMKASASYVSVLLAMT